MLSPLLPLPPLLSPTSTFASKILNPPPFSYSPFFPLFLPLPLSRRHHHHRRFLRLVSSHNDPIQSDLFPSIIDPASTHLPAVRTYESDLAILSITGSAGFNQAVTAAAADGGVAAEEHLSAGAEAMILETVFPAGTANENSTIATRIFLPAKKVKEKASKLRKITGSDTLSGSENILPMVFRQVVMDQSWSFSLTVLAPGSERNRDNLTASREVKANFTVSSSDGKFLSSLSEVVCTFVIGNIRNSHNKNLRVKNSSLDLSVSIDTVAETDMMKYVMNEPEILNFVAKGKSLRSCFWEPPRYRMLERFYSKELVDRIHWFLPAYRLQVMLNAFKELKLEGWHEVAENRWEVLLTHFQMMELANILDLYYEDQFTLPGKKLLWRPLLLPVNPARNTGSFLKVLLATITGLFVISLLGIGAGVFRAHLSKPKVYSQEHFSFRTSGNNPGLIYSTNIDVLEEICTSVMKKIKEASGSSGEIIFNSNVGAWIGTVPSYLKGSDHVDHDLTTAGDTTSHEPSDLEREPEIEDAAQNIASFQVVLSEQGEIVGFQPTSRAAVGIWASHPLTKELYKGRKLTPGILEPNLKIPRPEKVVVLELLMSTNPDSFFALARPIREHGEVVLAKG